MSWIDLTDNDERAEYLAFAPSLENEDNATENLYLELSFDVISNDSMYSFPTDAEDQMKKAQAIYAERLFTNSVSDSLDTVKKIKIGNYEREFFSDGDRKGSLNYNVADYGAIVTRLISKYKKGVSGFALNRHYPDNSYY